MYAHHTVHCRQYFAPCILYTVSVRKKEPSSCRLLRACARLSVSVLVFAIVVVQQPSRSTFNKLHTNPNHPQRFIDSSTAIRSKYGFGHEFFVWKVNVSRLVYEIPRETRVCVRSRSRYLTYVCHRHKNQSIFIWIYDWRFCQHVRSILCMRTTIASFGTRVFPIHKII